MRAGVALLVLTAAARSGSAQESASAADGYGIPQVRLINEQIRQGWSEYEITPSDPAADGDSQPARPMPDHLYFAVPDLDAVFARAGRLGELSTEIGDGGLPMGSIAERPWGERSFYMRDPFGNPLCFVDEETLFTGS